MADSRKTQQLKRGIELLKDSKFNKGQAFTSRERQLLGIQGLLPPAVYTQDEQVRLVLSNLDRWDNDLDRYIYIMGLLDRNEKLFYRVVCDHVERMMPIIYTPTVGLACQKYGLISRKPRGLFISIKDKGHISEILANWPERDVKVIVVTDGQRILGLGDLGCFGMGIPVGKLALYSACAGVNPHQTLPITLDVGTNNKSLLEDPLYTGLRQERVTGQEYDDFIEEFMTSVVKRFGQKTLIQFEDFGNHNAFRLLSKYRNSYCTFNDDIQGTAAVSVAGIIASTRLTGKTLSQGTYLFQGAGEAAIGIASLLLMAMEEEGTTTSDALKRIWMVDSRGLIVKDRPKGGINDEKKKFAQVHDPIDSLEEAVRRIKPTAIIGVAAVSGAFTEQIIKDMGEFNKKPVIFALSNPTSKAECTAKQAYTLTQGRCVFASGSPFDPVTIDGKTLYPGQGNNAYIFPGLGLAVALAEIRHIQDDLFLKSAQALASQVSEEDLAKGRLYPALADIRSVSVKLAVDLIEHAYAAKIASRYPEPADKRAFVQAELYSTQYEALVPETY